MSKKCSGCGITLQDTNKDDLGYTPNLKNNYCMRCFKLNNYNELISMGVSIDNGNLINKINKKKCFVIFLVDFLNIYEEVIETYKSINKKKMLVITKSDLIPNNLVKKDLLDNIKNIYGISDEVMFVSSKTKENLSVIANIIKDNGSVLIAGFTNAGKSSIINTLVNSSITVSKRANTTQDFIRLSVDGVTIIDAPGFISKKFLDNKFPKEKIKPITYQLLKKYYLKFSDFNLYLAKDTNVTIYMDDNIDKRRLKEEVKCDVVIPSNHDLVIKGRGFIKFSKQAVVGLNIGREFYEVRPSIVGGKNE